MKLFKLLARGKVFYSRAALYISVLNFLMIMGTFKKTYSIHISLYLLVPLGVIFVLAIGIFDYHMVMANEIEYSNKRNDIRSKLDELDSKIEVLLNDKSKEER